MVIGESGDKIERGLLTVDYAVVEYDRTYKRRGRGESMVWTIVRAGGRTGNHFFRMGTANA